MARNWRQPVFNTSTVGSHFNKTVVGVQNLWVSYFCYTCFISLLAEKCFGDCLASVNWNAVVPWFMGLICNVLFVHIRSSQHFRHSTSSGDESSSEHSFSSPIPHIAKKQQRKQTQKNKYTSMILSVWPTVKPHHVNNEMKNLFWAVKGKKYLSLHFTFESQICTIKTLKIVRI